MKKRSLLILLIMILMSAVNTQAQEIKHYADTPENLLPYGKFLDPYMLFFDTPQPFLGPGREADAPPNLTSVKIGFVAPLEGSYDDAYGQAMLHGANMAISEANAGGG